MSSYSVAAWNVQECLAIPEQSQEVTEAVLRLGADVVMLTDAYWLGNPLHGAQADVAETALARFQSEGYKTYPVGYGDIQGHWPGRHLLGLARGTASCAEANIGVSHGPLITITDGVSPIHILGAHFSDRYEGTRVEQAHAVGTIMRRHFGDPFVLAGDLNCTNAGDGFMIGLLKSNLTRRLAELTPPSRPRNNFESVHGRPNKLQRLSQMMTGEALKVLEDYGLNDANHDNAPTFPAKRPFVSLDHIMYKGVETSDFCTHRLPGSDHLAVSAKISL